MALRADVRLTSLRSQSHIYPRYPQQTHIKQKRIKLQVQCETASLRSRRPTLPFADRHTQTANHRIKICFKKHNRPHDDGGNIPGAGAPQPPPGRCGYINVAAAYIPPFIMPTTDTQARDSGRCSPPRPSATSSDTMTERCNRSYLTPSTVSPRLAAARWSAAYRRKGADHLSAGRRGQLESRSTRCAKGWCYAPLRLRAFRCAPQPAFGRWGNGAPTPLCSATQPFPHLAPSYTISPSPDGQQQDAGEDAPNAGQPASGRWMERRPDRSVHLASPPHLNPVADGRAAPLPSNGERCIDPCPTFASSLCTDVRSADSEI